MDSHLAFPMVTITALLIKFVMTFVFAWLTFGLMDGNLLSWIFFVTIIWTILNYLAGDLVVLPKSGNIIYLLVMELWGLSSIYYQFIYSNFCGQLNKSIHFCNSYCCGGIFFHQFLL